MFKIYIFKSSKSMCWNNCFGQNFELICRNLKIENYENGAVRQMCNVFGTMKPGECSENLGMLICICDSNGCNDTSMIKRSLESGDFELTNSWKCTEMKSMDSWKLNNCHVIICGWFLTFILNFDHYKYFYCCLAINRPIFTNT